MLLAPPELCVEQAAEQSAARDASHAAAVKSWLRVGEPIDAEAGEQAEGGVERRNVEAGEGAKERAGGEGEVADEPERAGCELRGHARGEGVDVGLREAVEEEVRDYEVSCGRRVELEGGALQGGEASEGVGDGCKAAAENFVEHGGADVDCDGGALRVAEEELLEEAAVAIAEHECAARIIELVEKTGAGALQQRAKGDVLAPAVDRGDAIEVWLG